MRKPEENLNEFSFKAVERSIEPPPALTLQFVGEVEVLKPLARVEGVENGDPAMRDPFGRPSLNRFSWFQSAVAAAAVFGIMIVIFLSAIEADSKPGMDLP